ncbi:MAG: DNA-processing protein DprA [bacterium]
MLKIIPGSINSVGLTDRLYPQQLKRIAKPPSVLYFSGALIRDEKCIAVVGSRTPTAYGKQVTIDIVNGLINAGITIVSGLAPGIDTIAHKTAVNQGKRTIAVLGTGLDKESIYPRDNLPLAEEIIDNGGCLISEYPEGTAGTKFTFPQRNRIISGLSLAITVIEAKERSGALITAGWARKQKRSVCAVPGSIYSPLSRGTNQLIKQGTAVAVTEANDILKIIGHSPTGPMGKNQLLLPIDSIERRVIEILTTGPLAIDEIINHLKLPAGNIISALSILEINGMVNNLGNGMYGLNAKI